MHPSGKWLLGSNRGHDSIVIYSVADDGTLTHVDNELTGGKNDASGVRHPLPKAPRPVPC